MTDEDTRYGVGDVPEPPLYEEGVGSTQEPKAVADEPSSPGAGEAWREVIVQLDVLADSMGRWAKAAVNDPENRRHAEEIRAKLDSVGDRIAATVDDATKTDIGRTVQHAAEQTGRAVVEAGGKVAAEAAPVVASVLGGVAGFLGKAADRVSQAAEKPAATEPTESEEGSEPEAGDVEILSVEIIEVAAVGVAVPDTEDDATTSDAEEIDPTANI